MPRKHLREELRRCVISGDFQAIEQMALQRKSILNRLFALTYDPDERLRDNAVEALAAASTVLIEVEPDRVKDFCRRLLWMLNDESGNMGWFAPQALGAIISANHTELSEFLAPLLALLDEDNQEAITYGLLWALGRIGPVETAFANRACSRIQPFLSASSTAIREIAAQSHRKLAV